jgi:putrescine transport system permease protein
VIASFTSGPGGSTLPLLIWSKVRLGLAPEINALATLLMLVVMLCLLLSAWLFNRARSD